MATHRGIDPVDRIPDYDPRSGDHLWIATGGLGDRRAQLLAELAEVETQLHERMREMRTDGATLQEIIAASGYRSITAVRQILDPAVRDAAAKRRQRVRSATWGCDCAATRRERDVFRHERSCWALCQAIEQRVSDR